MKLRSGIDFEWDNANRNHIARHRVSAEEAEQLIENDPLDVSAEIIKGEERFVSLGRTAQGRFLVVVTTMRGPRVRVVTAFPAAKRLIDFYISQRGI